MVARWLIKKQALSALLRDEKVTNEDESHVDKTYLNLRENVAALMIMR